MTIDFVCQSWFKIDGSDRSYLLFSLEDRRLMIKNDCSVVENDFVCFYLLYKCNAPAEVFSDYANNFF